MADIVEYAKLLAKKRNGEQVDIPPSQCPDRLKWWEGGADIDQRGPWVVPGPHYGDRFPEPRD